MKVISVQSYPTVTIRKHECCSCGYQAMSTQVFTDMEKYLMAAYAITKIDINIKELLTSEKFEDYRRYNTRD